MTDLTSFLNHIVQSPWIVGWREIGRFASLSKRCRALMLSHLARYRWQRTVRPTHRLLNQCREDPFYCVQKGIHTLANCGRPCMVRGAVKRVRPGTIHLEYLLEASWIIGAQCLHTEAKREKEWLKQYGREQEYARRHEEQRRKEKQKRSKKYKMRLKHRHER